MTPRNAETSINLKSWHQGNREGLDHLLERHLPWLRDQVRRRLSPKLRSKAESSDFVQDAMVHFLQFGPRFIISDDEQFRALLFRIVENTIRDTYDFFTALRRNIARERPLPPDTVLNLDPPMKDRARTPSKSAERNEEEAWVRLGLELLDPEERAVLVLRKWESRPFLEIGERIGVSEDAARKRHDRALVRLGEKIWALRGGDLARALGGSPA